MLQFGPIQNPFTRFGSPYGSISDNNGLLFFLSNIIQLISVVAGLWVIFNLVIAGINWIGSSGDPEKVSNAWKKINYSLIGLVIVVGANALGAIVSRLLFGEYDAIFQPTIYGPGSL